MKLVNIKFEDIDYRDYPDFCDAHITYAEYEDGTPLTDQEIEDINEDGEQLYDLLMAHLF